MSQPESHDSHPHVDRGLVPIMGQSLAADCAAGGSASRPIPLRKAATVFSLGMAGLAILILAAHFYRSSQYGVMLCSLGLFVFLCTRSAWKQYALGFFLLWGFWEWAETGLFLAQMRMQMGQPWMRAAVILFSVGAFSALAGLLVLGRAKRIAHSPSLNTNKSKARTKTHVSKPLHATALLQGAVFICTFLLLFYLRKNAHMQFLMLERFAPSLGSVELFFVSWYAAFAAGLLADPQKSRKRRRLLWLLFGCVFFAQFILGVLGLPGMLLTGKLHVPIPAFIVFSPVFRESLSMMPFIALAAVLLTGSAWCSLLCYFGPFDALAAGSKPVRPYPSYLLKALKYGRAAVLLLGVALAVLLRELGISTTAAVAWAVSFGLFSVLIMAVLSRKYGCLVHCTTFCPMGLAVNILGRLSPWRIRIDSTRCGNCGACEKVCRYAAITPKSRALGKTLLRCSLCRDCVDICPHGAISLRCPGLSPQAAWNLFAGLLAVLHALFLAVAMV